MPKRKTQTEPEDNLIVEPMWKPPPGFIDTGITLLNLAITDDPTKGFPLGRVIHVWGAEASAKSAIIYEALGDVLRHKGIAEYDDAEGTFDADFAAMFGLALPDKNFHYSRSRSIEEFFDGRCGNCIKTYDDAPDDAKPLITIAPDTLSVMPSAKNEGVVGEDTEKKRKKMTDGASRGALAKPMSTGFRRYGIPLNERDITLLVVNQARSNPNVTFGDSDTVSGGRALHFYASVECKFTSAGLLRNKYKSPIGVIIKFKVNKNKVGRPYREGQFQILFGYGIDNIGSNVAFLLEAKSAFIETAGAGWYSYRGLKAQGEEKLVRAIEENDKEQELEADVTEEWGRIHAIEERKPKRRRG